MFKIILTATQTNNPYDTGKTKILKAEYQESNLFIRYTHQPNFWVGTSNIELYEKKNGRYLNIWANGQYKNDRVSRVYVYSNRYDPNNTPLVFVVFFTGNSKSRYWRRSIFLPLLNGKSYRYTDNMNIYTSSYEILRVLIDENDNLTDFLTYRLDRTKTGRYNGNKIYITEETNHELKQNGIKKYKHTPSKNATSCYLYGNGPVMGRNGQGKSRIIEEVQKEVYTSVSTYWSSSNEPLMLEFNHHLERDRYEMKYFGYYISRKDDKGIYFEVLKLETPELKDLVTEGSTDVYSALSQDGVFIKLLKRLESNYVFTIYLLLDKRETYKRSEIESALSRLNRTSSSNNRYSLSFLQPYTTDVTQQDNCSALANSKYVCYEHKITTNNKDSGVFVKNGQRVELKFITTTNYGGLTELRLYNGNGSDSGRFGSSESYREYIYVQYGSTMSLSVFVYFHEDDNRPLMFYHNRAYRARSLENYINQQWLQDKNVTGTSCQSDHQESVSEPLITALNDVCKFLKIGRFNKKKPDLPPKTDDNVRLDCSIISCFIGIGSAIIGFGCYIFYKKYNAILEYITRFYFRTGDIILHLRQ